MLDTGEACLIVIGKDTLDDALRKADLRAEKTAEKQLAMNGKDLEKELADAEKAAV
jgi:hypothetical protein